MLIRCGLIIEYLHTNVQAVVEGHVAACVVACCARPFTRCDSNGRWPVVLFHSAKQL